jgi:hypothetical protein
MAGYEYSRYLCCQSPGIGETGTGYQRFHARTSQERKFIVSLQGFPDRIDHGLDIIFVEGGPWRFYKSKFCDQDIAVDRESLIVHYLFSARDRAPVNDDPLIGSFTHTYQLLYSSTYTGKAGTPAISFSRQLARGGIGELPDIRSDT